jgi:hypothetical protein
MKYLEVPRRSWPKLLEQVVREYNNTTHSVTLYPAIYLMTGRYPLGTPTICEDRSESLTEAIKLAHQRTKEYHDKNKTIFDARHAIPPFTVGDRILMEIPWHPNNGKLKPAYQGPFTILRKINQLLYEIDKTNLVTGKHSEIVNARKLKPYYARESPNQNIGNETEDVCNFKTTNQNMLTLRESPNSSVNIPSPEQLDLTKDEPEINLFISKRQKTMKGMIWYNRNKGMNN